MNINKLKLIAITLFVLPVLGFGYFNTGTDNSIAMVADEEIIKIYKTKCMACHTPKATKFYDPEMPLEEQVEIILKGKKGEKPPFMPEYETKGIDAEKALALAEYMKQLRTPEAE